MNKETEKALRESIAHWKRMADFGLDGGDRPFSEHCHLCERFCDEGRENGDIVECVISGGDMGIVEKCPVFKKTGEIFCGGSPYGAAFKAWEAGYEERFKFLANEEVNFLKSLLPGRDNE